MKRFACLCLSLMLSFSLSVSAFAQGSTEESILSSSEGEQAGAVPPSVSVPEETPAASAASVPEPSSSSVATSSMVQEPSSAPASTSTVEPAASVPPLTSTEGHTTPEPEAQPEAQPEILSTQPEPAAPAGTQAVERTRPAFDLPQNDGRAWATVDLVTSTPNILNIPNSSTYYMTGKIGTNRCNLALGTSGKILNINFSAFQSKMYGSNPIDSLYVSVENTNGATNLPASAWSSNPAKDGTAFPLNLNKHTAIAANLSTLQDGNYNIKFSVSSSAAGFYSTLASVPMAVRGADIYFPRTSTYYQNQGALNYLQKNTNQASLIGNYDDIGWPKGNDAKRDYAAIINKAQEIVAGRASEEERISAIHDWICDNIYYDSLATSGEALAVAADPVKAFNNRRAVCSGYARIASIMLRSIGIPSVSIQGYATANNSGWDEITRWDASAFKTNHEWNAVYTDGSWQYLDTTWDSQRYATTEGQDSGGYTQQKYFLMSPDFFSLTHRAMQVGIWSNSPAVPPAAPGATPGADAAPTRAFVERLYKKILNRGSDAAGLQDWTNRLMSGNKSAAEIMAGFLSSPEFQTRSLSNSQKIDLAYQAFLNRNPDAQGKKMWMGYLESGMTIHAIGHGFAQSPEFVKLCQSYGINAGAYPLTQWRDKSFSAITFLGRLYRLCLDRGGDPTGLEHFSKQLLTKTKTPQAVAYDFVFSNEFTGKNYSDRTYIMYLYRAFLGREYDEPGLQNWLAHMQRGQTREQIFNGFAQSKEFGTIVASFGL